MKKRKKNLPKLGNRTEVILVFSRQLENSDYPVIESDAKVATTGGKMIFVVDDSPSNLTYIPSEGRQITYVRALSENIIGESCNIEAGMITEFVSGVEGFDSVTNETPGVCGTDTYFI